MTERDEFNQYWLARQRERGFGSMLTDEEMLARPERKDDDFHAWQAGRAAWRCFHCNLVCTTPEEAELHFGTRQFQQPACQIDAAEYRRMEERMRRYNEEDADIHREMYRMAGDHRIALKREEEKGYGRGIADMREICLDLLAHLAGAASAYRRRVFDATLADDFDKAVERGRKVFGSDAINTPSKSDPTGGVA